MDMRPRAALGCALAMILFILCVVAYCRNAQEFGSIFAFSEISELDEKMPQFRDRFPIMYDFGPLIELMNECRIMRQQAAQAGGVPCPLVTNKAIDQLIVRLHREMRAFNTFVWEVRSHVGQGNAVSTRQQRALAYYFHALGKAIEEMHRLKRNLSRD